MQVQVHHLIEECMVFNMSKEECMEALFKHANIKPVITSTGPNKNILTSYLLHIYIHISTHTHILYVDNSLNIYTNSPFYEILL